MINRGDGENLRQNFSRAGEYRTSMEDRPLGVLKREYSVYVDIPDRPGTIANVVNILYIHEINLKNIGILYNREFEESVLKVDFYDENACEKADRVLKANDYMVFKK